MNTLLVRYELIQSAQRVASQLGADAADRFVERKTGCSLKATTSQFFNNRDIVGLGINRRTPKSKIMTLLASQP